MIEQLEAALAEEFSHDNLQVYGDALQATGDPRGHLIAIDLHIARHGPSRELAYRRRQRLREWLQLSHAIDPTKGPWRTVKFAFGFVEDTRALLAIDVLKSPAGRYVRGISLSHGMPHVAAVLHELGSAPRPWLDRLSIISRNKAAPPTAVWGTHASLLEQSWVPSVIAATPRLRVLELAGARMVRAFPHPQVSRIRLDGVDVLQTILEPGPAMPAVRELELTFAQAIDAPVLMERPWPSLVPAASFPAVTRLDLSENWKRGTTDTQASDFDVLTELGIRDQLEELRLWGINHEDEWARFRRISLPALRRLELEHEPRFEIELPGVAIAKVDPHWPRDPGALDRVWAVVPRTAPLELHPIALARHCSHARAWLHPDAYAAVQALWQTIEALPYGGPGYGVASAIVRRALDGLGYLDASYGDLRQWQLLRDRVRGDGEVWLTMFEPA